MSSSVGSFKGRPGYTADSIDLLTARSVDRDRQRQQQQSGRPVLTNTCGNNLDPEKKIVVVNSDEFQAKLANAATKIQRWYRNTKHRQQQTRLLQTMLSKRKNELNQSIGRGDSGLEKLIQERKDIEVKRKKQQEQKARDNRQSAIVSLKKIREDKRLLAQMAAEDEYVSF